MARQGEARQGEARQGGAWLGMARTSRSSNETEE